MDIIRILSLIDRLLAKSSAFYELEPETLQIESNFF